MARTERAIGRSAFAWRPSPRTTALFGVALVLTIAMAVHSLGRTPPAWYPPRPVHLSTGLHCPGCGSGRAVHALAQGDVTGALAQNACLMVFAPLLGAWFAAAIWCGLRHDVAPPSLPSGTARVALVLIVAFTVARNLPWWPLSALAPGGG